MESTASPIDFKNRRVYRFSNPPEIEQALVRKFFGNKRDGYFVDVGANHPTLDSQSRHLEEMGWTGLLIEPTPSYCEMLRRERRGTVAQYACSSPENHDKRLKLIAAGVHSTLNPSPIALGAHGEDTIEVTCKTLDSVLEEYGVKPGFEFISIDIEGHEMEMFKGFTLSKWQPRLVLLEDHVVGHDKHNHMTANGYLLIFRTGLNSWYIPDAEKYGFSVGAKLEMFRKYWLGLPSRKLRYSR
ncbi:MAG: FkbM family methyltransferase [Burkholderiales bacterium]|nr:FkbM family methyltransferase [Burkholderiales bacterium]